MITWSFRLPHLQPLPLQIKNIKPPGVVEYIVPPGVIEYELGRSAASFTTTVREGMSRLLLVWRSKPIGFGGFVSDIKY